MKHETEKAVKKKGWGGGGGENTVRSRKRITCPTPSAVSSIERDAPSTS